MSPTARTVVVSTAEFWLVRTKLATQRYQAILQPTTCHRHGSSSSSNVWLQRQRQDPFVRARTRAQKLDGIAEAGQEVAYVARSAFKLLELQERYGGRLLRPGMNVVDLGAAPGGWIQVASQALTRHKGGKRGQKKKKGYDDEQQRGDGRIIAVDLLPLKPQVAQLPHVSFVQGNFVDPIVQLQVAALLQPPSSSSSIASSDEPSAPRPTKEQKQSVDLVLSDMMSNMSGNSLRDAQASHDLCCSALAFALDYLAPEPEFNLGSSTLSSSSSSSSSSSNTSKFSTNDQLRTEIRGSLIPTRTMPPSRRRLDSRPHPRLIIKSMQSCLSPALKDQLQRSFRFVKWDKPTSSRNESREGYWVCSGLKEDAERPAGSAEGGDRSTKGDAESRKTRREEAEEEQQLPPLFF